MRKEILLFLLSSIIITAIFYGFQLNTSLIGDNTDSKIDVRAAPISITSNSHFSTYANGGGAGNATHPWILENYVINAQGLSKHGIHIVGTSDYFIIRNCIITNALGSWIGINIIGSANGYLTNNTIKDCNKAIKITTSSNMNLSKNKVNNNYRGITIQLSDSTLLEQNTANDNTEHGIYLEESENCTLKNNTANDNGGSGIHIAVLSHGTMVSLNSANLNKNGIFISNSNTNTITNNTANNNNEYGINLDTANSNIIKWNVLNGNILGCWNESSCVGNTITNNSCQPANGDGGIPGFLWVLTFLALAMSILLITVKKYKWYSTLNNY